MKLKPFQEKAISELKDEFLHLWKREPRMQRLTFKSPTGSGKTIMMAQFLRDIISDPRFSNADVGFLWITNSDDIAMQSKDKLFKYYSGASENPLLDMNDLNEKVLPRNGVFFINWQKLVSRAKDNRKLRTEGESNTTFDEYLENTHNEKRNVVLIIDEEHIASRTVLTDDLIKNVIKPKIIIGISATPEEEGGILVEVKREDVVESGLIKEKIIFQTKEDLDKLKKKSEDEEQVLLELAFNKREELLEEYKKLKIDINPLVLIQIPNDDKASRETSDINKQTIILNFLKHKGIKEDEIAIWLSQDKVNLDDVETHNSKISFLIFKQAVATGWDCPRASVLVMFREIKNPTFAIQTSGRILRMPFGEHFPEPKLNQAYIFTNYKRNEVIISYDKNHNPNRPAIHSSYRRKEVEPIEIISTFMSRTDYNDLGDSFQNTFKKIADKKLKELKGLDLNAKLPLNLIVDVEIDDYDNFKNELLSEGDDYELEMSQNDIEKLYNLMCYNILKNQTDENKKFAPERSWSDLKTALNVWLLNKNGNNRRKAYKTILSDLLKEDSILKKVISDSLEEYRPVRESEVKKKSERKRREDKLIVPPVSLFFTDDYKEYDKNKSKKSALHPFYIHNKMSQTEKDFIKFLDEKDEILWWYKNGDIGSEYFAIDYYNKDENKDKLFYPDWIVKTKSKLFFLDTKAGITARDNDTKYKAEALQKWLKKHNNFEGGIAVKDGDNWKINNEDIYSYEQSLKGWKYLSFK